MTAAPRTTERNCISYLCPRGVLMASGVHPPFNQSENRISFWQSAGPSDEHLLVLFGIFVKGGIWFSTLSWKLK